MTSFFLGALFGTTLVVMLTVMAVHTGMTDEFELGPTSDGAQNANIVNDVGGAPPDWAEIFDANGNFNDSFGGVGTFLMDDLSAKGAVDDTTFATSNKNNDLISTWRWDTGNNPPKDDISNVYFYGKFIDGDLILYAGLERLAPNGDSHVDFEFNQDGIALDKATPCGDDLSAGADDDPPCEFVGEKAVNDLLLVMDFERGGSLGFVEIRRWDGSEYVLVEELQGEGCDMTDTACAFNNATTIDTGPWDSYDRHGAVVTELEQNAFTEIGVNVTELLGVTPCFSTVQAKTRSSQSFNSELKDFAQGGFDLCSIEVVKDGEELAKIGDEVTYDFMITNTGEITLFLESIIDDKLGNITSDAPGSCDPLAPGGSCSFSVAHTIPEGASDPYDNIVTATYDNAAALDGTDVTDSDDHSLNLFQPAIAVDKTGDDLSKVGDDVDYSITLSNNSSADTPDLHCVATDSLLGVVFDDVLPLGDTVLTPSYTVQAGDPDPLVNTVTLTCSPDGFPNVLEASDGHSTNLFQPVIAAAKTGDELSKVGDDIDYSITLSNNSSADTPALTCTATDSLFGEVFSGTLPLGDTVINRSRTVLAGDPDPLVNTVDLSCSPDGFPNVLDASAMHSTNLFQPAIAAAKTGDALSKVGDDVDYSITLSNNSSADTPAMICTATDSLLGEVFNGTLPLGDTVLNLSRTVLAGDPDPLVNSVDLSCSPDGFPNILDASAMHSTNLFQPAIAAAKTGDALSKVGDDVDYSITLSNNSSADTPALTCTATDSLLGVVFSGTLPLGDTVLTPSRTVLAGDPDPLVNTVDLSCSPDGFPNVLDASDSHSTDLFQASIALDKTGDTLSKVGDSVDYVITLDNTSSSDTPDLECTISDTLLGVSESVTLASGAQHVINASRVVQAGDPDPLLNTAEASCSPIGFANVLTDSDGHSVQLFQASITLDKTGDTLSKVGDSVDYVITLDNTSSADTPDLECTITDTLLGVSQSATLASGAQHVINASRVVLAGDPDPVVNTAEVSCSPIGFANVLTDSDGHSVNLFQPSITVDKSNDCDPITGVFIGQNITYSYLITNTSSADTPALNVLSIIDSDDFSGLPWPGLGDLTGVEASCASLASGASCSFNVVQSTSGLAQGSYGNKVVATYQVDGWPNQAMAMDNDTCPVFPPNPARLVVEKVLENAEGLTFFYDSSNIVDVPGLAWDETLTPVLPVAGQNAASPFAMPTEAFATTVELTVDVPDVTQTVEVNVAELMPTDAAFVDLQCAAATGQSLTGQSIDLDLREATLTMASDDFAFCRFVNAKIEFCPGTFDEDGNFISNFGRPKELEIRYDGDPASNGPQLGSGDVTIDPDPPAYVPEEVYIEVYDNRGNKEQLLLTTGTLMVGDTFTYTGADGSKVPPTSLFRIYDAETGELIQTVEFHTSCSQPLDVGDSYGLLTVAGGELGDPQ
ncbi:hypothetical protein [Gallaecimonas sp. GXIMD4217]|uniref:DUF7507 domain-containing protein n=1 Tax=Gallaecimonas sp. GXIMD4217 TaxID=3131927 RepID=UPI00311B23FE